MKESNKQFLERYIPLVDFIAAILGNNSEVVLNDPTDLDNSVVYIKNGELTGRKVGDPASNFVLKIVNEGLAANEDYIANYSGKAPTNSNLRSSTFFIKGDLNGKHNQLRGMICVNTNQDAIDSVLRQMNKFRDMFEIKTQPLGEYREDINSNGVNSSEYNQNRDAISENFTNSVEGIADNAVKKLENQLNIKVDFFKQEQKLQVVKELYSEGYFLFKNSIQELAKCLKTSEQTIYRYLRQVKSSAK